MHDLTVSERKLVYAMRLCDIEMMTAKEEIIERIVKFIFKQKNLLKTEKILKKRKYAEKSSEKSGREKKGKQEEEQIEEEEEEHDEYLKIPISAQDVSFVNFNKKNIHFLKKIIEFIMFHTNQRSREIATI